MCVYVGLVVVRWGGSLQFSRIPPRFNIYMHRIKKTFFCACSIEIWEEPIAKDVYGSVLVTCTCMYKCTCMCTRALTIIVQVRDLKVLVCLRIDGIKVSN